MPSEVAPLDLKSALNNNTSRQTQPFLVWYDLDERDTLRLMRAKPSTRVAQAINILGLRERYPGNNANDEMRIKIMANLCVNVLQFCAQHKFSALKTSTLLSLFRITHQTCCEVVGPLVSLDNGYAFFEQNLLRHSVERPPFSVAVFAHPEVKAVSTYAVDSYFRHLKMYQHIFGTSKHLKLTPTFSQAERVDLLGIPQLSDGVDKNQDSAAAAQNKDLTSASLSLEHPVAVVLDLPAASSSSTTTAQQATTDDSSSPSADVKATSSPAAAVADMTAVDPLGQTGNLFTDDPQAQAQFNAALDAELVKLRQEFAEKLALQESQILSKMANQSYAKPEKVKKDKKKKNRD